jgi:hypothetical protein
MIHKFIFNYLFLNLKTFCLKILFINFVRKLHLRGFGHDFKLRMFIPNNLFKSIIFLFINFNILIVIFVIKYLYFKQNLFKLFSFKHIHLNFLFNSINQLSFIYIIFLINYFN